MAIKIITDSGSDLPIEYIKRFNVSVVNLSVHFNHEKMPGDMDAETFYHKMRESKALPTTASPSPLDFLDKFKEVEEGTDILVICMSSNISSTYQTAMMALDMYREEGHTNRIEIIDSKTFSGGLSLVVGLAAQWAESCKNLTELKEKVVHQCKEVKAFFTLETLENVIKGGRLNRLSGAVASVLNIKLLLKISEEGTVEVVEKTRGMQNALKALLARLEEKQHDYEKAVIAIVHSNCEKRALEIKDRILEKHPFKEVLFSNMGPIMGTYAGEGGVGIAF
ncbi:DegV family protein with EDD domain [Paenibacillus anaericanus]|uniref:DegV family protein n=1 Tax=Paenibacillus anaericanus TaxID=170367 RepID=A0A433YC74_9BACL|nr:DegV family protein [Paenibacillus anaericanus]MDQ0088754.1 DegV family protein with EDD domain [Paenibacillus anaericanus]RUT47454.1 DegV family protein [Paenibacillus anaericanus]